MVNCSKNSLLPCFVAVDVGKFSKLLFLTYFSDYGSSLLDYGYCNLVMHVVVKFYVYRTFGF